MGWGHPLRATKATARVGLNKDSGEFVQSPWGQWGGRVGRRQSSLSGCKDRALMPSTVTQQFVLWKFVIQMGKSHRLS